MSTKPVAAGKSSMDLIDRDLALDHIVSDTATAYLDLACGAGRYTMALAERAGHTPEIHALDLWPDGIAALQQTAREAGFTNIKAAQADATRPLPLEDKSIDVCLMATILHDLPAASRGGVIREVARVLRPKGRAVIIEFRKQDKGPGPSKEHRIGEADAEALLSPFGFTKDTSVELGEFTYLIRFIRD